MCPCIRIPRVGYQLVAARKRSVFLGIINRKKSEESEVTRFKGYIDVPHLHSYLGRNDFFLIWAIQGLRSPSQGLLGRKDKHSPSTGQEKSAA